MQKIEIEQIKHPFERGVEHYESAFISNWEIIHAQEDCFSAETFLPSSWIYIIIKLEIAIS